MDVNNIYSDLREKILNFELIPGKELKIKDLTNQYGVSRSPVRDVLNRLSSEDLVTIVPQSGTKVSLIDMKIVKEEQFLRTSLELSALALASLSPSDIALMEEIIIKQTTAFQIRDMKTFLQLDNYYHSIIFKGAKKEKCFALIQAHSGNYQRIRRLSFSFDNISQTVLNEHNLLTKALKEKNLEKAQDIDYKHINKLEKETADFKAKINSYFK